MADEPIVEPIDEPIDTPPIDEPKDDDPLAKLEQSTKSWLGRQEKSIRDLTELVTGIAENQNREPVYTTPQPQTDEVGNLNEKWQNEILSGNVIGVLDEYQNLNTQAQTTLRSQNLQKVDNFMSALKDDPLYEKIKDSASKVAKQLVLDGSHTPATAVKEAYLTAKTHELEGVITKVNQVNPGMLETIRAGGSKPTTTVPNKFDPKVEARIEQDIADGVFANRQEWIAAANPRLKESLGI